MYSGLQSNDLEGQFGYIPRGRRLELKGICTETEFLLRLIVDSKDLGDREDFKLPADLQDSVTQRAFEKLAAQIQFPQDVILDNTPQGKI